MRIKLDYRKYYDFYCEHELLDGPNRNEPEEARKFSIRFRAFIADDIREHYEHDIREKCLRDILSEGMSLSETEPRMMVDERTNRWIKIRSLKELDKTKLFIRDIKWRTRFKREGYIATDEELKEFNEKQNRWRESIINKKPIVPEIFHIKKNGLDVLIKDGVTVYKCKDGTIYKIDHRMRLLHQKNYKRLELIVQECAEAGLHVDWIAKIFCIGSIWKRRVVYIAKKLGYNIDTTPRSQFKTAETLRVLDEDGMFIVEKPNPYRVENQSKSADGMVKK